MRVDIATTIPDASKRATYLFLRLTLAFSSLVWALIIWSGHLAMGFGLMIPLIMWCPALAALVSCRNLGRTFRSIAWRWPNNKYIVAAYIVPHLHVDCIWRNMGMASWRVEFGIRQRGCPELRAARLACMGLVNTLYRLHGQRGSDTQSFDCTWRRDRLARFSDSRTGQANVIYQIEPAQRHHLDSMAYPATVICGLQRWNQPMVRARLQHSDTSLPKFHPCVA